MFQISKAFQYKSINSKSTTYTLFSTNADYRFRSDTHKIAILIDGENAESSLIADFIAEAGRFGKVTVKRIYADWTTPEMKGWKGTNLSRYLFAFKPTYRCATIQLYNLHSILSL